MGTLGSPLAQTQAENQIGSAVALPKEILVTALAVTEYNGCQFGAAFPPGAKLFRIGLPVKLNSFITNCHLLRTEYSGI